MRLAVNLADNTIVQVEKSPPIGDNRAYNGKYAIPIPDNVPLDVGEGDYVLPIDGGDVFSRAMSELLAQYPMYNYIEFNPLLTAADMDNLDLAATLDLGSGPISCRAMIGRGTGVLPAGASPNSVSILPYNDSVYPARPGCLITDTITTVALPKDFMIWYQLYEISNTEDISASYGVYDGTNQPALRNLSETDQEDFQFRVFLSNDDGATYTLVERLTPIELAAYGTQIRIAFTNYSTERRYLAAYAILF